MKTGLSEPKGWRGHAPPPLPDLTYQVTLSHQKGQIMPTTFLLAPPPSGFLDVPTDLEIPFADSRKTNG
jgi:hypothetical protein